MADRLLLVRKDGQSVQIPAGDALRLRGALNEAPIVRLYSMNPVDLGATLSNTVNFVYWDATVASFGSAPIGVSRVLIRTGSAQDDGVTGAGDNASITLVHSSNLRLPGAANITMIIGDSAKFVSLGSGRWFCEWYTRADGTALVSSGGGSGDKAFTYTQSTASAGWTVPHNLGKRPSVTVVGTDEAVVLADVSYTDDNIVQITFGAPFAGKAYLN
ncbi:hypothetical protein KDX38_11090 [Pseudomonas sp. CDFA 602]|uniref:hypothetical protein n=1 Tax=Pseudomonas californiensis TaxID=2829823 RepID=UPI001E50FD24|nr:hypothetical protein [Pseudomonas californiensis]MCD5994137.1 hypothetical protein [Pseudomonas californiensis]MCD5999764.1 hypothetical protein [Pseudomonas californiensis]